MKAIPIGSSEECLVAQRLGPKERLRRERDFRRVYLARCRSSDARLMVYAYKNDLPHSRLGVSVGRRHGTAVARNRLKRILREAYRLTKHKLPPGFDYVLIPAFGREPSLTQMMESLKRLGAEAAAQYSSKQKGNAL